MTPRSGFPGTARRRRVRASTLFMGSGEKPLWCCSSTSDTKKRAPLKAMPASEPGEKDRFPSRSSRFWKHWVKPSQKKRKRNTPYNLRIIIILERQRAGRDPVDHGSFPVREAQWADSNSQPELSSRSAGLTFELCITPGG